jgi:hypothetical protein
MNRISSFIHMRARVKWIGFMRHYASLASPSAMWLLQTGDGLRMQAVSEPLRAGT